MKQMGKYETQKQAHEAIKRVFSGTATIEEEKEITQVIHNLFVEFAEEINTDADK